MGTLFYHTEILIGKKLGIKLTLNFECSHGYTADHTFSAPDTKGKLSINFLMKVTYQTSTKRHPISLAVNTILS